MSPLIAKTEQSGPLAMALISAATLHFEVFLTRHIAIEHWHHLTSVVIAIALLGFGIAGTLASIFADIINKHYRRLSQYTALVMIFSFPVSQWLAHWVPLNMLAFPWHTHQYGYLVLYALCWLPPFLLAGFYITVNFIHWSKTINRLYCADLIGGAIGALLALALLSINGYAFAISLSPVLAGVALFLLVNSPKAKAFTCFTVFLLVMVQQQFLPSSRFNSFKSASIQQNEAGAKVLWQHDSAHSRLSLLVTPAQHAAPGMSINSNLATLSQWQLFFDGDSSTPILLSADTEASYDYFSQSIYAAPYQLLVPNAKVLLTGEAPSWNSWLAHWHRAGSITLLDPGHHLSILGSAMTQDASLSQAGNIFPPTTELIQVQPRRFIEVSQEKFDLIMATVGSDPVGTRANKANYLLTQEGLAKVFDRLSNNGLLALSNLLFPIPRDNLRVINSLFKVLGKAGLDAKQHLAIVRDWRTILIMVTKSPISQQQRDRLYNWSRQWRFDLEALPKLSQAETNRFHIKSGNTYFDGIKALTGHKRQEFSNDYVFKLEPSVDDKPFLYHAFRWQSFAQLTGQLQQGWPLMVGWGYLLSIASLLLITPLAFVLILLPLYLKPQRKQQRQSRASLIHWLYFSCLGIGFMAIEIALLNKSYLLLESQTSAFATLLSAILIGTGLGSLFLGKNKASAEKMMLLILLYGLAFYCAFLLIPWLFQFTLSWSLISRVITLFILVTILTLPLGSFLPYGLARLTDEKPASIAWCWGINGFASVFGVLLAPLFAMEFGLNNLLTLGVGCYLLAGFTNLMAARS